MYANAVNPTITPPANQSLPFGQPELPWSLITQTSSAVAIILALAVLVRALAALIQAAQD